jgi:predicted small metal-binding protein
MVKQVVCERAGHDCAFEIRSEDEDELIEMVQAHAQDQHGSNLAPDEVRGIWSEV